MRILGISGSLRKDSHNTALLRAAAELLPPGVELELFDGLRDVPPYDADEDVPELHAPGVLALKDAIERADAVLIATPEYNHSIPGVLKNALDWASRAPERAMQNKAVAIVGATPGRWGTVRSQLALRQMLMFPACRVMPAPLMTIAGAREHFDSDGNLTNSEMRDQLAAVLNAFATWIRRLA